MPDAAPAEVNTEPSSTNSTSSSTCTREYRLASALRIPVPRVVDVEDVEPLRQGG
jgi:hypothetical protein